MPAYPRPPDFTVMVRDLKRRTTALEAKLADLGPQPVGSPGTAFDANVVFNGGFESGTTYWGTNQADHGALSVEAANPMAELYSLRVDERASDFSRVMFLPGGAYTGVGVDLDVASTAPGDVWQASALMRASATLPHGKIVALFGLAPADCFQTGPNSTRIDFADVALTANTITALAGTVTTPASRNYVAAEWRPCASLADPIPASSWQWWLDACVLRKQL